MNETKNVTNKTVSEPGLMQTLGSLQFGIVVLIAITVVSIAGTVIPQGQPLSFYRENYGAIVNTLVSIFRLDVTYRSPLFIGLLGLFGLNLILCSLLKFPAIYRRAFVPDKEPSAAVLKTMPVSVTIPGVTLDKVKISFQVARFPLSPVGVKRLFGEKGRIGYLGAFIVHVSLLLFLAGGVTSLLTGQRGHIMLIEGETADSAEVNEMFSFPLGFSVRLNKFEVSFYEDFPDRPKSYTSSVTVTDPDGASFEKEIRVNSPLMLNDFTIYQSSYGHADDTGSVSAADDTARVEVRLKGAPESMPPIVTFDMVRGATQAIPGFGDTLAIRLSELHRSFSRGGETGGPSNPAVKIDVLVQNAPRWSVYAFENFPGLNMPMYEDLPFSFAMTGLFESADSSKTRPGESRYYTVLGVVRDRGVPIIWIGAAVMMAGFLLAFYIRPRRLWVLEENGSVIIGGIAKGDTDALRVFVRETMKTAN